MDEELSSAVTSLASLAQTTCHGFCTLPKRSGMPSYLECILFVYIGRLNARSQDYGYDNILLEARGIQITLGREFSFPALNIPCLRNSVAYDTCRYQQHRILVYSAPKRCQSSRARCVLSCFYTHAVECWGSLLDIRWKRRLRTAVGGGRER